MLNFYSRSVAAILFCIAPTILTLADGPSDNKPTEVRQIPPPGIRLTDAALSNLSTKLDGLRATLAKHSGIPDLALAEAEVFVRAVELAIELDSFYSEGDFENAQKLLEFASRRIEAIVASPTKAGVPAWLRAELSSNVPATPERAKPENVAKDSRLIVGGFRSKLDGSIQPYAVVIPASFDPDGSAPLRLDVWLHGRGEKVTELQFLHQRSKQVGEFAPENTIVLHPFGRYSNAFKFAGEVDVLEAIEHVKGLMPIDSNRINIRGFSMGGAGCWQLAVHYPGTWMAATPGAGFSETREFLAGFQQEVFVPTKYQESLLHWYDCPDWSNNLRHLPTIAYSGELDRQKQAADKMEQALRDRGLELTHLIGPQTAHKIHPDSKVEIETRIREISKTGRQAVPRKIDFTTYTLRYNEHNWINIQGLQRHWTESRVQADIETPGLLKVVTQNIDRLAVGPIRDSSLAPIRQIEIDGQTLKLEDSESLSSSTVSLQKRHDQWAVSMESTVTSEPTKRPGLQGPIDDAFLSPFVFVAPENVAPETKVDRWVNAEFKHATMEWRRHFRGDVVSRSAATVSDDDKKQKNLILFGTPSSNPLIAEVMKTMPLRWTSESVRVGSKEFASGAPVVIAIYPSPFADDRYVVINSGFTFREYAYLNNARQIPMLPDWAVVDVTDGATTQLPGMVLDAGFFDESWQIP
jgi:dienelactone hydrolase